MLAKKKKKTVPRHELDSLYILSLSFLHLHQTQENQIITTSVVISPEPRPIVFCNHAVQEQLHHPSLCLCHVIKRFFQIRSFTKISHLDNTLIGFYVLLQLNHKVGLQEDEAHL